ncbi:RND transporter [Lampropedia cohaerens]|uniref:RND transporter n=1 Tax=Lampropedia cohaerens TaxID=1610491 RepID=A0A0U1PXH5_9BURK|nr:RND transporter [Lampropedia cohaerens]
MSLRAATFSAVLVTALALAACSQDGGQTSEAAAGGAAAQAPAPEVGVVIAKREVVGMMADLPGRVEASRVAQVRARAAGILQKRLFTEGSDVKAGELLMKIDPAPYQAAEQSARAQLARAEAALAQAKAVVDRYRPLVAVNAVSQLEFDNADAAFKAAQADVAASRSALRTAQINLGYADVTAPISGRIGRALVTEGALVGQGDATPLAVIQQINPVYVNFTQSSTEMLELRRRMREGQLLRVEGEDAAQVQLVLEDGTIYGEPGKLLFSDVSVDPASGQVMLRAEVPNNDGTLLPGMYVRVRLEQAKLADAIAVPQEAVTRTQNGDFLTIVDAKGNRQQREVKIMSASGNRWLVTQGLEEGEMVMVDGLSRLQMLPPNVQVKPVVVDGAGGQPVAPAPVQSQAAGGSDAASE